VRSRDPNLRLYQFWGAPVMRRARGSTRRNALSSGLEPGARHGRVADRQTGGVATRVPQPQPPPHHHTTLTIQRPRAPSHRSDRLQSQQEYRAWVVRPIPSESGRSGARIPLNLTKTSLGLPKTLEARAGPSGSNKRCPQRGLVPPSRPCHVGGRPTSRDALQGPGVSP
jgi:hypothetical protein